jgi:hypothetical protein
MGAFARFPVFSDLFDGVIEQVPDAMQTRVEHAPWSVNETADGFAWLRLRALNSTSVVNNSFRVFANLRQAKYAAVPANLT